MKPMPTILVVDDEPNYLIVLSELLRDEGFEIYTAPGTDEAVSIVKEVDLDLVITDMQMPGKDGSVLMREVSDHNSDLPVIIITAYAEVDKAVAAMQAGAFSYLAKPFANDELIATINRAVSHYGLIKENIRLREEMRQRAGFGTMIGKNPQMIQIYELIEKVAPTPASVLITGESGTGKELVAKAIHKKSKVHSQPFVPITCSAIPEELMESELFGHIKGSFTGAISDKSGLFKEANNGTAFLDEIGELTPIIQTKLLRVLQEREIKPVGGTKHLPINVRIIAATNRILEEEIQQRRFREDLFYRLAVVPIRVPSLRERKSDIPLLVEHFLEKYSTLLGKEISEISSYALEVLMDYDFPGNVRELENIIERGVALESSSIILPENLSLTGSLQKRRQSDSGDSAFIAVKDEQELFDRGFDQVVADLEKKLISHALEKTGNSKTKAAELLKVSFRSLRYKTKKYDL